jgi:UDP-N-acetylglucosamine--N-acetylmuramyl-(pentapeptide) pyrophosphoryl-undecaprenol N-acetylglucosamine transferase
MNKRVIISGGGTGGHVFPAIAIADALKIREKNIEVLFVGSEDKLEMKKVPEAGYEIKGLPVEGLKRKLTLYNVCVVFNLLKSLKMAGKIIKSFRPDAVVGVGGYASGPVLWSAARRKIPTVIQEQNSYAGITNRILARRVNRICVAYEDMNRYFPDDKIIFTGNPVRDVIRDLKSVSREEGLTHFGLSGNDPVLLVLGGSLGARTINRGVLQGIDRIRNSHVQLLWQCGDYYYKDILKVLESPGNKNIVLKSFIARMDLAYAVADAIIARAGAITISELCFAGKPVILVPSPNVAEDHQTKNAMALVKKSAAIHVADDRAEEMMIKTALEMLGDTDKMEWLAKNIKALAVPDSALKICEEIRSLMNE